MTDIVCSGDFRVFVGSDEGGDVQQLFAVCYSMCCLPKAEPTHISLGMSSVAPFFATMSAQQHAAFHWNDTVGADPASPVDA